MNDLNSNNNLDKLPNSVKWLHGEGAGCWFHISHRKRSINVFQIKRYNELGVEEFDLDFGLKDGSLNLDGEFEFDYPSHAMKCTIMQEGVQLNLIRLEIV